MKKATSLEDLVKKYLQKNPMLGTPDSYDLYSHKNGLQTAKSYSDAVNSLYASSKKNLSSFGSNNRKISNKGLQNSGFSKYIDSLSASNFASGSEALENDYAKNNSKARLAYASYLEKYRDKQDTVKKNVMSHLINNDIVDLNTAVAYGLHSGLSKEDAEFVGQSAYEVTKQKLLNKIIEQTVSLGLDSDGAKMLALKMGVSEADADGLAEEVNELLKYYRDISKDYLEFLEQRSK